MNLREKQNLTKRFKRMEKFHVKNLTHYGIAERDDILIHPIFLPEARWSPRREKNRGP